MTLQISQKQYELLSSPADWVLFGGAAGGGKSYALMLDMLRHCQGPHGQSLFRGAIYRQTFPQLSQSGGLIDQTKLIYGGLGAVYNHTANEHRFPVGAKVSLNTLDQPKKLQGYLGAQFDSLAIDEANQFEQKAVLFLWARCRSQCGIRPTLRMTSNPDHDSWLFPLVSWYLDDEGYPRRELSGKIRHFMVKEERFQWFDEPQYEVNPETGLVEQVTNTFAFIPAKLSDNQALQRSDPTYRKRLMQLSEQERERYLEGCWLASSRTGQEWPRECFQDVTVTRDQWPQEEHAGDSVRMFAVDPSKGKNEKSGDYSAIVCLTQTRELKYVDADLARRPPGQIVEDLFRFCEDPLHRVRSGDLVGIEATAFQEVMRDLVYQYAADHSQMALSQYLLSGNPLIPVKDMLKKEMRIRRLDGPIRRRELRFLDTPGTLLLLSQLRNFDGIPARGKHDDGPDALDQCQQLPLALQRYWEEMRKQ